MRKAVLDLFQVSKAQAVLLMAQPQCLALEINLMCRVIQMLEGSAVAILPQGDRAPALCPAP